MLYNIVAIRLSFHFDRSTLTSRMRGVVVFFIALQNVLSYSEFLQDYEAYVSVEDEHLEYAVPIQCTEFCSQGTRDKREDSPGRSRFIDAMLKSPSLNLDPANTDFLSITRDRYELPEGMCNFNK